MINRVASTQPRKHTLLIYKSDVDEVMQWKCRWQNEKELEEVGVEVELPEMCVIPVWELLAFRKGPAF